MSRKKAKGKGKAAAKKSPHSASKRHYSQPWPAMQDAAATPPKYSLKDQARWVSSHRTTAFEAGKKLRHLPIEFVSAGHLEGTLKEHLPSAESASESEDNSPAPSSPSSTQENTDAMAHMAIRSPSPAVSDVSSSSDEVVFQGRGPIPPTQLASSDATQSVKPTATAENSSGAPSSNQYQPKAIPIRMRASITAPVTRAAAKVDVKATPRPSFAEQVSSDSDSMVENQFAQRRGGKPAWEGTTTAWQSRSKPNIGWLPVADRPDMNAFLRGDINPRDTAMDDYMQNMEDFGLTGDLMNASGFAHREMDLDAGSHNDWESLLGSQGEQEDARGEGEEEEEEAAKGNDSWDSDMLRDLEDMSTSSDVMDTVERILSKRTRSSGLHYLCVYEGSVTDDARWLPATFLKSGVEQKLIRVFEEEVALRMPKSSESGSTGDEEEDDDDDDDDNEELDDETIARVLQKQEELGLGSDEVLLYAADEYFSSATNPTTSFRDYGRPNKKRQSRGRGNRDVTFPSASAMADALAMDPYGGFDIMDTERPSLKPKKKGRRGQMPPELDDSDLNEQLQNSWEADRAKKRLKKAEREELRQQGLLGRKGKAADLKVKYSGGIGMEDVVEEIREFMLGDRPSLSLPPMDAHRRATIHQAAKIFDLSSRSRGDGHDRFTVLSRTSRTRIYTDAEFDHAMLRRGFLKRLSGPLQGKKGPGPARTPVFRSGPRARPQVGYRDGEKVGANAPELGPENKGHALMMKMGWSKGMALGTTDNQGILHPIAHTVKTNKAGLQ
jgi:hypothetical protein